MPDIGQTAQSGTDFSDIEAVYAGSPITMTEAGTVASVTAHLQDTAGNSHTVRAVVWDTSGNIVDESGDRSDITTEASYTFTGFAGSALSDATEYIIGVACNSADGTVYLYGTNTAVATDGRAQIGLTAADLPPNTLQDPATLSNESFIFDVYLTYNTATTVNTSPSVGSVSTVGNIATSSTQVGENETQPLVGSISVTSTPTTVTYTYQFNANIDLVLTVSGSFIQAVTTSPSVGNINVTGLTPVTGLEVTQTPGIGSISTVGQRPTINQAANDTAPITGVVTVTSTALVADNVVTTQPAAGLVSVSTATVITAHGIFISPITGTITMSSAGIPVNDTRTWVVQPRAVGNWSVS